MAIADSQFQIFPGKFVVAGCKVIVCRYRGPGNWQTDMDYMRNGGWVVKKAGGRLYLIPAAGGAWTRMG
jgi:hypothetical protein